MKNGPPLTLICYTSDSVIFIFSQIRLLISPTIQGCTYCVNLIKFYRLIGFLATNVKTIRVNIGDDVLELRLFWIKPHITLMIWDSTYQLFPVLRATLRQDLSLCMKVSNYEAKKSVGKNALVIGAYVIPK